MQRVTGGTAPQTYQVNVIGDYNNVFKVPEIVTLPLGLNVEFPIKVSPHASGIHSAILEIRQPDRPVARTSLVLIAATPIVSCHKCKTEIDVSTDNNGDNIRFISVPKGTMLLSSFSHDNKDNINTWLLPLTGSMPGQGDLIDEPLYIPVKEDPKNDSLSNKTLYNPPAGIFQFIAVKSIPGKNKENLKIAIKGVSAKTLRSVVEKAFNDDFKPIDENFAGKDTDIKIRHRAVLGKMIKGSIKLNGDSVPELIPFRVPHGIQKVDVKAKLVLDNADQAKIIMASIYHCRPERCYVRGIGTGPDQTGLLSLRPRAGDWVLSLDAVTGLSGARIIEYEIFLTLDSSDRLLKRQNVEYFPIETMNGADGVNSKLYDNGDFGCFVELVSDDITFPVGRNGVKTNRLTVDRPIDGEEMVALIERYYVPIFRSNFSKGFKEKRTEKIVSSSNEILWDVCYSRKDDSL